MFNLIQLLKKYQEYIYFNVNNNTIKIIINDLNPQHNFANVIVKKEILKYLTLNSKVSRGGNVYQVFLLDNDYKIILGTASEIIKNFK